MINSLDFTEIIRKIVQEELKETAYKIGTITSIVSGKPRIMFDGEAVASGKGYSFIQSYAPNVGDRVLLSRMSGTYIITGKIITDTANQGGSLIESGSNTNGYYTRFSDGTQICTGTLTKTGVADSTWGSLYYIELGNAPYAKPFISKPHFSGSGDSLNTIIPGYRGGNLTTTPTVEGYRAVTSVVSVTYTFSYVAIGKWK